MLQLVVSKRKEAVGDNELGVHTVDGVLVNRVKRVNFDDLLYGKRELMPESAGLPNWLRRNAPNFEVLDQIFDQFVERANGADIEIDDLKTIHFLISYDVSLLRNFESGIAMARHYGELEGFDDQPLVSLIETAISKRVAFLETLTNQIDTLLSAEKNGEVEIK